MGCPTCLPACLPVVCLHKSRRYGGEQASGFLHCKSPPHFPRYLLAISSPNINNACTHRSIISLVSIITTNPAMARTSSKRKSESECPPLASQLPVILGRNTGLKLTLHRRTASREEQAPQDLCPEGRRFGLSGR